ncbi:hypothetical protein KC19_3G123600 [Ceratodon purpureus]|uniref:X8 domain-containing protein n=1 Tax=Ceratodon purpureus TaxID=3225 RepID=A0A8T0IHL2_CERPU|nr:hypothetical protein KC19_3G123600 [Ceratodon purpureus]KAG0583284.1 hypothetical protein KC19_3G123600 [Ceratodon purpureus]
MEYSRQRPVTNSARSTTRANNTRYTELPRSHVDDEIPKYLTATQRDEESLPISFHQRVTNLVEIDNANVPNGADQPPGNQVLKKALDVCGKEIKISTSIIDKLESRSDIVKAYTHQVLGLFIVFQGVLITVLFKGDLSNEPSPTRVAIFSMLAVFLVLSFYGCIVAVTQNAILIRRLKRNIIAEKNRHKRYERYELEIHVFGAQFALRDQHVEPNFEILPQEHPRWHTMRNYNWDFMKSFTSYKALLVYITLISLVVLSLVFVVYQKAPTLAEAPAPSISVESDNPGKTWCIAKVGSADKDVMNGLNFACGEGGVDCGAIQVGGACFNPDTIASHASFAYNTYYQNMGRNSWNCYFGGTGVITITDPSYSGCSFL